MVTVTSISFLIAVVILSVIAALDEKFESAVVLIYSLHFIGCTTFFLMPPAAENTLPVRGVQVESITNYSDSRCVRSCRRFFVQICRRLLVWVQPQSSSPWCVHLSSYGCEHILPQLLNKTAHSELLWINPDIWAKENNFVLMENVWG